MDVGAQTIEWLYTTQLQVDAEWSVRTADGFRWWADQQEQTVEVVGREGGGPGEPDVFLVAVRTEFLADVEPSDDALAALNGGPMSAASLSGPVHDPERRRVDLCTLVPVHEGNSYWMNSLLSLAAVQQIVEARWLGPGIAEHIGARLAVSAHPENGPRTAPDEMIGIVAALVLPAGREPSRWSEEEFTTLVEQQLQRPPSLMATGGREGVTVEFPWADESSLCRFVANEPHPAYGSGLVVLQSFPVESRSEAEGVRLALAMNRLELIEGPFGYGFGSYVWSDGTLHFAAFFPNKTYLPGLLSVLSANCANRARRVALHFTGRDWDGESFSPGHSAMGRAMLLGDEGAEEIR